MSPRYFSLYVVIVGNCGGAYKICQVDGTVLDRLVSVFHPVPRAALNSPCMARRRHTSKYQRRIRELEQADSCRDETFNYDDEPDAAPGEADIAHKISPVPPENAVCRDATLRSWEGVMGRPRR